MTKLNALERFNAPSANLIDQYQCRVSRYDASSMVISVSS